MCGKHWLLFKQCPSPALLFILVVEVMTIEIRNNDKVKGIAVGKNIFKICKLADDTTLFLDNSQLSKQYNV